jgi:hypothetical protein
MAITDNRLGLAVGFLMLTSSLSAQTPGQGSGRDVHVSIETDRATYRVGEPIKVRLTLHNISPNPVQFSGPWPSLPMADVNLVVTDESNHKLEKDYEHGGGQLVLQPGRWRQTELTGGGSWTLSYNGSEWMDLEGWYYRIAKPGRYVITGVPSLMFSIPERGGGPIGEKSVRSNEAAFSIEP